MAKPFLVVAFGGTLRPKSSTELLLRALLRLAGDRGVQTRLFSGADLNFPMYAPNQSVARSDIVEFLATLRQADAIIMGSPGYHGGVSGLVKNAIDYTEELALDARPYFSGRPVGCVASAFDSQSGYATLQALRNVTHALKGWPIPQGIVLTTRVRAFDDEGACSDGEIAAQMAGMMGEFMAFLRDGARKMR